VADVLIDAHRIYGDDKYLRALAKLGDFLLLAQMPPPQPGWAQQYNYEMKPIWARKFEPPGVSGDETQEVLQTLMKITHITGDEKYLEPIPSAAAWLKRSQLRGGGFARYYELKSNRPLYMNRKGDKYFLTYDDRNLPSHYGWKTESQMRELGIQFKRIRSGKPPVPEISAADRVARAQRAVKTLDPQGRWVSNFTGERLVGQAKMPVGTPYLSSQVFSDNLTALSDYVRQDDQ
jgi:hypothetical protein